MALRVLVVEDDTLTAVALRHALEREGCVVETVRSGEEALRSATRAVPDAASLDLKLSGDLDGYQVLKRLRSDARTAGVPVAILTNHGLDHEIERGQKSGAEAYLVKTEHSIDEVAACLMRLPERKG